MREEKRDLQKTADKHLVQTDSAPVWREVTRPEEPYLCIFNSWHVVGIPYR